MKVWVASDYDIIDAVFSTEEKAKLYCEIHNEDYDEYEVDECEIDEDSIEMYDVYEIYVAFPLRITTVSHIDTKHAYKNGIHFKHFPQSFKLNTCGQTYLCQLYVPQPTKTEEELKKIAYEMMMKEFNKGE